MKTKMQLHVKNIIFDFDGVLADTKILLYKIFKEIHPDIEMEDFLAHHDGNIYSDPKIIFSDLQMDKLFSIYKDSLGLCHIKHGKNIIRSTPANIKLFIVSSNDEEAIIRVLNKAGILKRFTEILGRQSGKSKVDKINRIVAKHRINLSDSIFVTDTLGDIKEAKDCKIPCVATTYGFHPRHRLRFGKPDFIVDNASDLMKLIASKTRKRKILSKSEQKNKVAHHM